VHCVTRECLSWRLRSEGGEDVTDSFSTKTPHENATEMPQ
jgi:hypothetical protein